MHFVLSNRANAVYMLLFNITRSRWPTRNKGQVNSKQGIVISFPHICVALALTYAYLHFKKHQFVIFVIFKIVKISNIHDLVFIALRITQKEKKKR